MAQPLIEFNQEQVKKLTMILGNKWAKMAARTAVYGTLKHGRAVLKRAVSAKTGLPAAAVLGYKGKRALVVTLPEGDAAAGKLTINPVAIPAIKFPEISPSEVSHPQAAGGIRVQFQSGKPALVFSHAFLARMPSSHIGAFFRFGPKGWRGKGDKAYFGQKIREVFGPSILTLMGDEGTSQMAEEVLSEMGSTLMKNLTGQVARFLETPSAQLASDQRFDDPADR